MKSGALAIGSPELAQMVAAHAQLARYYKLPSRSGGALTDANYPDAQAGFESMMGLLTTVNSGVDLVLHAAASSAPTWLFPMKSSCWTMRYVAWCAVSSRGSPSPLKTLAYDVVAGVGPGGNYLMETHTVKRCRKEFWKPDLCDRSGLEAWMQEGRRDAVARARARWQMLVAGHVDPPLDELTARQLRTYVQEHSA